MSTLPSRAATRPVRLRRLSLLLAGLGAAALLTAALLAGLAPAAASSHREAPLISKDALADNTDTYVFISPNNSDNIVLVANWIPFEGPEAGPNYFEWDDNVLYEIHVDNNGDARPDFTYSLQSKTTVVDDNTFLYNIGPIGGTGTNWNRQQTYTLTETEVAGSSVPLLTNVLAPPVNIGSKSTSNYEALDDNFIYSANIGGDEIKIFAGQRDDPFWVDLQIFDLLTLRGQNAPIGTGNANNVPIDSVSGFNVHSLVIELPVKRLVKDQPVLGVWATAKRPTTRVLDGLGGLGGQTNSGPPVQVSRLGMPLVNEVVMPYALKDAFNALKPEEDVLIYLDPTLGPILQKSIEDPELGRLLCALYGIPLPGDADADCDTEFTPGSIRSGRADIFDIFLTGMTLLDSYQVETGSGPTTLPAGYNINRPPTTIPAEVIRINTEISGTLCSPTPNRLGLLGGDLCGFPNGRRLADDVIDIEMLIIAGGLYQVLDGRDSAFTFDTGLVDALDDGLDGNDASFSSDFPYLAPPNQGENHYHQNILRTTMPIIMKSAQTAQDAAAENPLATAVVSLGGGSLLALNTFLWWRRRREDLPGEGRG